MVPRLRTRDLVQEESLSDGDGVRFVGSLEHGIGVSGIRICFLNS